MRKRYVGGLLVATLLLILQLGAPVFAQPETNTNNNQVFIAPQLLAQTSGTPDGEEEDEEVPEECLSVNPLSWLLCPVLEGSIDAMNSIYSNFIVPLLAQDPLIINGEPANSGLYDAWSSMRTVANGLFVVVFLIIIFSQALSLQIDAYTVKRMLPRLVAAVVIVQLSFFLCGLVIDIVNILGYGVRTIISPAVELTDGFINYEDWPGFEQGAATAVVLGAIATAGLGLFAITPILLSGLIAIIIGFLTLLLREVVIIGLVILSPIAAIAWVLPNTKKFADQWWDLFSKALLMFPLIMGLIALGEFGAAISDSIISDQDGTNEAVNGIIALALSLIPFFVLPFTFRFAGGVIGTISGMANDKTKGIIDRKKTAAREAAARRRGEAKSGSLTNGRFRNRLAQTITNPRTSLARAVESDTSKTRKRAGQFIAGKSRSQAATGMLTATGEAGGELNKAGITNAKALAALAKHGMSTGGINAAREELINNGEAEAAEQVLEAQQFNGSLQHRMAAASEAAKAGKLSAEGAVNVLGGIGDSQLRNTYASNLKQLSQGSDPILSSSIVTVGGQAYVDGEYWDDAAGKNVKIDPRLQGASADVQDKVHTNAQTGIRYAAIKGNPASLRDMNADGAARIVSAYTDMIRDPKLIPTDAGGPIANRETLISDLGFINSNRLGANAQARTGIQGVLQQPQVQNATLRDYKLPDGSKKDISLGEAIQLKTKEYEYSRSSSGSSKGSNQGRRSQGGTQQQAATQQHPGVPAMVRDQWGNNQVGGQGQGGSQGQGQAQQQAATRQHPGVPAMVRNRQTPPQQSQPAAATPQASTPPATPPTPSTPPAAPPGPPPPTTPPNQTPFGPQQNPQPGETINPNDNN